ncbi:MAG: GGDEF domain-containing protein [Treponema sp.]|jgi:diguanylate cyclase (GGDEF)-like protein|nr:GGDEF domain-containing protein [Treponema sp.]
MRNLYYSWRFYTFGREQYYDCMNKVFSNNLLSLRQVNLIIAVFAGIFSAFPIVVENDFKKAGICAVVAVIALLLSLYSNFLMQQINIKNRLIYIISMIFYTNITLFGTYLGIWSNADRVVSIFSCFLICALLLFLNPPHFNFFLTVSAMVIYIVSSIIINKVPRDWIFDIVNVTIAGVIGLFFNWSITKLRMGMELSTTKLEEERSKYLDQSILDELTQLRNRRDFTNTFHRYVVNFRTTDDYLCVAICDIDFFKGYNDHYGHPKGDDCLRAVGGVLNSLKESMGVYAARVGGEEFAMLWFEKDVTHVDTVVQHVMKLIGDLKIPHEKSKVAKHVSMSIGIFVERCGAYGDTQTLYDLADKALYSAKTGGRNCAIVHGDEIKNYKILPPDAE